MPSSKEQETLKIKSGRLKAFRSSLLGWYKEYGRSLPWRETRDPYAIWISEIILQQTQVKQGWDYYLRFMDAFPNVEALANASDAEVLKMWEGLGYYSRAHNLMSAARSIVEEHKGVFPKSHKEIIALKGIGPYTAAAIASIAFQLPHAVLDGNVYRVLSRFESCEIPIDSNEGKKHFTALADLYLDPSDPGTYNQAIMDFGALQCRPQSPQCDICPVAELCRAQQEGVVDLLPVKAKKVQVKTVSMHFFLIQLPDEQIVIVQRDKKSIWKGLFSFPMLERTGLDEKPPSHQAIQQILSEVIQNHGKDIDTAIEQMQYRSYETTHQLSHRSLHIFVHRLFFPHKVLLQAPYQSIHVDEHTHYAFPKPLRSFLNSSLGCGPAKPLF